MLQAASNAPCTHLRPRIFQGHQGKGQLMRPNGYIARVWIVLWLWGQTMPCTLPGCCGTSGNGSPLSFSCGGTLWLQKDLHQAGWQHGILRSSSTSGIPALWTHVTLDLFHDGLLRFRPWKSYRAFSRRLAWGDSKGVHVAFRHKSLT